MAKKAGGVAVEQLKSIIARVEKLEEEKRGITDDIKDVLAEAKGNGFDVKAIRAIIRIRKMDVSEREEAETILDTYMHALGMIANYDDDEEAQPSMLPAAPSKSDILDAELYVAACAVVVRDRKASTSYLQRALNIGYNRAAQLIEKMEADGLVGHVNHVGAREVLASPEHLMRVEGEAQEARPA